ncbi:MAG TPA: hypothetical protein VEV38_13125 [Candidatus Eremiobacteraceae bacterium]|nr:hypothetical protein [Candidatus Eremiobacteraceae bacterium]
MKVGPKPRTNARDLMEYIRPYQAAIATFSLVPAAVVALALAIVWHAPVPAVSLVAGVLIGLASLFHIAGSFDRLLKAGKGYVPFLSIEGVLRVLLAGAAPFLIVGKGPWVGYFTYLAGFVAPLAVAILVYRQQVVYARRDTAT